MSAKVMITGASGMLGQELVQAWQGIAPLVPLSRTDMDVTDAKQVMDAVTFHQPSVIVHAAAYTAVDQAQTDQELCVRVNVDGTGHVVRAAEQVGAKICYISTDYVFDGLKRQPYLETDATHPLNVYGQTKLQGEQVVLNANTASLVVRISWLCGLWGPNFVKTILNRAGQGASLKVVDDQWGVPTFTADVAKGLRLLLDKDAHGVYHMTSQGSCTWYQFAAEVLRQSGYETPLEPVQTNPNERPAQRPAYSVMSTAKLKQCLGDDVMPQWQESLQTMLRQLRSQTR